MRHFLFAVCMSLLGSMALAEEIDGTVVLKDDTMLVTLVIPVDKHDERPDYEKLQKKVKCYDPEGHKMTLEPGEVLEYRFKWNNELVRMISVQNLFPKDGSRPEGEQLFLKLEEEGPLRLFMYYHTDAAPTTTAAETHVVTKHTLEEGVFQRGIEPFFVVGELTFRRQLAAYFKECSQLTEKIESEEFSAG